MNAFIICSYLFILLTSIINCVISLFVLHYCSKTGNDLKEDK